MYQPILLRALEKKFIKKIDCGDFHSLALDDNGGIYSWGAGQMGQCGHGKFEDLEVPTKIRYFEGKRFVNIVAGNHHSLALSSQNELYGWGQGDLGQCGYGEFENTSIPQMIIFPEQ